MARKSVVGWFSMFWLVAAVTLASAQDRTHADIFGRGVHAFFAQDYQTAWDTLTKGVELETNDPRVYYYRGLAALRLGQEEQALADLADGARVELENDEAYYDVNQALQRIQGRERVLIERLRREARVRAAEVRERRLRARYENLRRAEERVLYDPNQPAAEIDLPIPEVADPENDPFAAGLLFQGGTVIEVKTPDAGEADDSPFGNTAPVNDTPPAADNPFGNEPPAENPFGNEPPAENPFGNEPPAENPFGDQPPAANPFGNEPPAAGPPGGLPGQPGAGGAGILWQLLNGLNKDPSRDPFQQGGGAGGAEPQNNGDPAGQPENGQPANPFDN